MKALAQSIKAPKHYSSEMYNSVILNKIIVINHCLHDIWPTFDEIQQKMGGTLWISNNRTMFINTFDLSNLHSLNGSIGKTYQNDVQLSHMLISTDK